MLATERVPRKDDAVVGIGEEDEDARPKKKRRDNVRLGGNIFTEEVDRFADSIRESDNARIAVNRKRLLSKQKRFEREMQEREKNAGQILYVKISILRWYYLSIAASCAGWAL